ncbi:phage major capsid protein [Pseudogemmobacter faecipullorum]|uniref:Phage major capsid protein n=1 Tax=Pseudogemmobacter faecipullorum TaxID=2755041 RepID=A0ABS8CPL5_9RHOB|nr:phage major capsid protein [Pseudogemmobacter faecipullorum]MCB5411311.1 phage major capsid protein [Pseudogemmobacter faecipullorum]
MDLEIKQALEAATGTLTEVKAAQTALSDQLRVLDEKKASGEDVTDIKGRIEDSRKDLAALGDKVADLTLKLSHQGADLEGKSLGRIIAEHDEFKTLKDDRKARFEVKDVTTGSFGTITLPGGVRRGSRGLIQPVTQALFLRDIIPTAATSAAVIEYLQETGFTNNAAVVAEGAQKPQSELTFEPKAAPMVKMAHFFRVTEETLDDVDGMEAYINQRGLYGLQLKEEGELLNGPGTTGRIDGLLANSTAYDNTLVPGVTPVNAMDDIRVAIAQVADADLMASAVIMNHLDAAALDLAKDEDGRYLHPAFMGNTAWGLPVVRTKGLPQGKFIVGGFVGNTLIWQRKGIEVRRSTEDRDNFVKNLVTILLEERLQLETLRPEGIVYGDLTEPTP